MKAIIIIAALLFASTCLADEDTSYYRLKLDESPTFAWFFFALKDSTATNIVSVDSNCTLTIKEGFHGESSISLAKQWQAVCQELKEYQKAKEASND